MESWSGPKCAFHLVYLVYFVLLVRTQEEPELQLTELRFPPPISAKLRKNLKPSLPPKIYYCISFHYLKSFQSLVWWDPLWAFATNLMLLANLDEPNEQRASDKRWPEYDAKMCKAMQFMCSDPVDWSGRIFAAHF